MLPQRTDLVLATDIPHGEADVLHRLDSLHIESNRRYGADNLIQLQLVQHSGLSSCIQPQHQDLGLTVGEGAQ